MVSIVSIVGLLLISMVLSVESQAVGRNCNNPPGQINLISFTLSPDPMIRGRQATLSFSVRLPGDLVAPIRTEVLLETQILFFWVTAPCQDGVGSCTYEDLCTWCPTCGCPFYTGDRVMQISFNLTTAVPTGNYRCTVNFRDALGATGCAYVTGMRIA